MFPRETFRLCTVLMLFLGWSSCRSIIKEPRLAVRKCEEYRKIATLKQNLLLLTLFPTSIDIESNICTNDVQRITPGEVAKYGEFPHQAMLGYPQEDDSIIFGCGGTLISDQHVMTAAQCFGVAQPTIVRLGEYDTTFATGEEYEDDIVAIRKHPDYKRPSIYHDIALVKLANRVKFSKLIRPACLWDSEKRNTTQYIVTGFGLIQMYQKAGHFPTTMKKLPMVEVPLNDCDEIYKTNKRFPSGVHDGQLCIRGIFQSTCEGDAGTPLQMVTSSKPCMYAVVGITSVGRGCDFGSDEIHTKVSHYLDWIEDNVWGSNAM